MTFGLLEFKCVLITGGAGGIGKGLAEHYANQGKKVIIVGRTESKLEETVKQLKNATHYVLDTGDIASIPAFIKKVTTEHPELDCIINNAGVQRPLEVSGDLDDFLKKADNEIDINIRGPMHLALGLLPHFRTKKEGAVIVNVTSVLGFIPFSIINPVYNGTKAFGHFWTTALRTQLAKENNGNIRVVEIAPPQVATDLHRDREDPDDNKGPEALTVDQFIKEVDEQMSAGKETLSAGPGKKIVANWYSTFGEQYDKAASGYLKG